jgi:hypothetical protein
LFHTAIHSGIKRNNLIFCGQKQNFHFYVVLQLLNRKHILEFFFYSRIKWDLHGVYDCILWKYFIKKRSCRMRCFNFHFLSVLVNNLWEFISNINQFLHEILLFIVKKSQIKCIGYQRKLLLSNITMFAIQVLNKNYSIKWCKVGLESTIFHMHHPSKFKKNFIIMQCITFRNLQQKLTPFILYNTPWYSAFHPHTIFSGIDIIWHVLVIMSIVIMLCLMSAITIFLFLHTKTKIASC